MVTKLFMAFQNIFLLTLMVMWGSATWLLAKVLSLPASTLAAISNEHTTDFLIASSFLGLNLVNFSNILASKILA